MDIFLNYGLAWCAMLITFILAIKYLVRKMAKKERPIFIKINKCLKKLHIPLGIALIAVALIHGIFSPVSVLSFNIGTICWIISILLGLSYMLRKRLNKMKPWIIIHRSLTVFMIVFFVWHIIDVGGFRLFDIMIPSKQDSYADYGSSAESDVSENINKNVFENNVVLKDGTYTGSAQGFRGSMTLSVVVEDGLVTSIEISSIQDDNKFYSRAQQSIPSAIIENQSLDVDAVSGATFSSVGMINAVNDALSNAVVSGDLPEQLSLPSGKRH